nr:acetyltransferase [Gordonia soli]
MERPDIHLRPADPTEHDRLVEIWRSAVTATHDFLTPADIDHYAERIAGEYLGAVALTVAEVDGRAVGFAGLADGTLEMLFVDDDHRGTGVGSALLADALRRHPDLAVDVNEQNPAAVAFYLRHGFTVAGRSATDPDGRPFPLLHLVAGRQQEVNALG